MSALSDALEAANRQGWSARRISAEARRRGHTLSNDTVSKYLRGDHAQPDEATLLALADALATSIARLREAAGIRTDDHEPFELPAEASRLTRRQREAVVSVVRAMLEPGAAMTEPAPETEYSKDGSSGLVQGSPSARPRRRKGA